MTELVDAVRELRAGRTTAVALTEHALDTVARHAEHNAMITLAADAALRAAHDADRRGASGPLHGVPFVVKDNIHVAGLPNTAGTPALADFVPTEDAPVVARLRAAGALVLGKANMHELSMGVTGAESAAGPTRNARHADHVAGGSSSGTGVLVALGVLAGLGTDTGGSVRIPAAFNGVCGLRPTPGRYPRTAITPLSGTRDTPGPIARTVADLALLDAVLAGEAVGSPEDDAPRSGIRLGVPTSCRRAPADRATLDAFEHALESLRRAGVTVVEVEGFEVDGVEQWTGLPIVAYEARRELSAYLRTYLPSLGLDELVDRASGERVRHFFRQCVVDGAPAAITPDEYERAMAHGRAELLNAYRHAFQAHELHALAFPTTPCPAGPAGMDDGAAFDVYTRNTAPGSLIGLPGLTLPVPVAGGGLPVGLGLDGSPGGDRALLDIGRRLERVLSSAFVPR